MIVKNGDNIVKKSLIDAICDWQRNNAIYSVAQAQEEQNLLLAMTVEERRRYFVEKAIRANPFPSQDIPNTGGELGIGKIVAIGVILFLIFTTIVILLAFGG